MLKNWSSQKLVNCMEIYRNCENTYINKCKNAIVALVCAGLTSNFQFPRDVIEGPPKFGTRAHVHNWIVDAVQQEHITQVGHDLT